MTLTPSKALQKAALNHKRNKAQDNTEALDQLTSDFSYEKDQSEYWNPERYSLLYGTPLWNEASAAERIQLNHLYWVAYYSQIISAEIATIFFNQTCAASLYTVEGFRSICDMLDLESSQERAHINAFYNISRATEEAIFGKTIFSYPMKSPYSDTMIFSQSNAIKTMVRNWLLKYFTLLSSSSVFIGCQYFTVRGLRTLNGKMVQHKLSQYYSQHADKETAPAPAKVSFHHFCDESYHFNSSLILSKDVIKVIPAPTRFERFVMNSSLFGCQKDHEYFSSAVNGIFWYEPALFKHIYQMLRSKLFNMNHEDANNMMFRCFAQENEGAHLAKQTHQEAIVSYESYLEELDYIDPRVKTMNVMKRSTLERYYRINRRALARFFADEKNYA
jgi:hypothetical protein